MKGFAGVSSDGLSGGLALFWDEKLQVTVLDSCARYIDVRIVDVANDKSWRTTFVYGEPRVENRHLMWSSLSQLRAVSLEPWLVCGDFNEAMWQHEHMSRAQRSENQMGLFRDCLLACELWDLGFSGIHLHMIMGILERGTCEFALIEPVRMRGGGSSSRPRKLFTLLRHVLTTVRSWFDWLLRIRGGLQPLLGMRLCGNATRRCQRWWRVDGGKANRPAIWRRCGTPYMK